MLERPRGRFGSEALTRDFHGTESARSTTGTICQFSASPGPVGCGGSRRLNRRRFVLPLPSWYSLDFGDRFLGDRHGPSHASRSAVPDRDSRAPDIIWGVRISYWSSGEQTAPGTGFVDGRHRRVRPISLKFRCGSLSLSLGLWA